MNAIDEEKEIEMAEKLRQLEELKKKDAMDVKNFGGLGKGKSLATLEFEAQARTLKKIALLKSVKARYGKNATHSVPMLPILFTYEFQT